MYIVNVFGSSLLLLYNGSLLARQASAWLAS